MAELEQELPPSRFILDLDSELELAALLEVLQLLENPPRALLEPGELRQWRARVYLRCSYLLTHCSVPCFRNPDVQRLAAYHSQLAHQLSDLERRLQAANLNRSPAF